MHKGELLIPALAWRAGLFRHPIHGSRTLFAILDKRQTQSTIHLVKPPAFPLPGIVHKDVMYSILHASRRLSFLTPPSPPATIALRSPSWHGDTMNKPKKLTSINVEGIPEPLARGLAAFVKIVRHQLPGRNKQQRQWPTKHGKVISSLRRRNLYDDVV